MFWTFNADDCVVLCTRIILMCIVSLLKGYNKSYLMLKSQVDISTENHELQQFNYQAQSLNKRSLVLILGTT